LARVADIPDGVERIRAVLDGFEPHTMDPVAPIGGEQLTHSTQAFDARHTAKVVADTGPVDLTVFPA
jgi:hypothetical protein